jgi:hypothetical protein
LKGRIFGSEPGRRGIIRFLSRRIPVGWAAVFALFAGLAGMYLSQWLRPAAATPSGTLTVQIVPAASDRNIFDFTQSAGDWLSGDLTGRIVPPEEI